MQIKPKFKRQTSNTAENMEQLEFSYISGQSLKEYNHFGELLSSF